MEDFTLVKGKYYLFSSIPFPHGVAWNTKVNYSPVSGIFELTRNLKQTAYINLPTTDLGFEWKGIEHPSRQLQLVLRHTDQGPCLFLIRNIVNFTLNNESDPQRSLINRTNNEEYALRQNSIELLPLNF